MDLERYQGLSDEEFVHRLYQDLLGREGDPEGVRSHLERLEKGKTSRQELAKDFLGSKEYRIKFRSFFKRGFSKLGRYSFGTMAAGVTARLAYRLVLERSIDSASLRRWKTLLRENRFHRIGLINSLFLSEEYNNLIVHPPVSDFVLLNYLHRERCKLVKTLPEANFIIDLGGSSPNNPRGALLAMGYPYRFDTLLIVDLPLRESLEQRMAKETYDLIRTELGEVRYIYRDMCDLGAIGLPENSVDLIWMGQSVEHIEESKFDELLALINKYLKPGGYYCFDTPNRRITSLQSPESYIHPDHKIEYFFDDLVRKLEKAGFEIVETWGIGLADEAVRQNRFLSGYVVGSVEINEDPEHSYLFYFKTRKRG